jgi:hypothetical protein
MGLPLITRTEYKAYVGITSPNSDAVIDALIPKVSELVKNYCRRTFVDYVNDAKVETTSGGYGENLLLAEYPVISVTSVGWSVDYGQNYTDLVEFTDYVVEVEKGYIVSLAASGEWDKCLNGYQVTYTAGYEILPEDLKLAVMDLVTYYIKNDASVHSPKAPGTNSVQIEYITSSAFPAHIKRVLDLYKASWD